MRLRQHTKPAANPQKTWQNSNAALPIVYLFFIIYLKSKVWTITRLENLSGVYVECYRFSIFVVTDSVYYKYQYSKTYTPTSGFNNFSSSNYSLNRCLFKPFHLLLTNTKIINQYRLTYTLCSELNSVPLYESERTREEIFIRIKGDNMSTF